MLLEDIDQNLEWMNSKCIDYNHRTIGELVMLKEYDSTKLQERLHGLYPVVRVNVNGTIDIQMNDGTIDHYIIRKVVPYKN